MNICAFMSSPSVGRGWCAPNLQSVRSVNPSKDVVNIVCIWGVLTISPKSLVPQICYYQILSGSYTGACDF